jgi:hypothetical protein
MAPLARAVTSAAAACAALAGCALLAGCASGPSAQALGQASRSVALPVAKQLYSQVTATGVGWIGTIVGDYETCGTNDPLVSPSGGSSLQYTAQELLTPFSRGTAYPLFQRQVVEALNGIGWDLRPVAGQPGAATYYTGQHDHADLRLIEINNQQGLGPTATIFVSDPCFDAGSSAQQLLGKGSTDNISEPHPTATPTPRYS